MSDVNILMPYTKVNIEITFFQFLSDNQYNRAAIRFGELHSEYTDVYFYQFSYHGELGGYNLSLDGESNKNH